MASLTPGASLGSMMAPANVKVCPLVRLRATSTFLRVQDVYRANRSIAIVSRQSVVTKPPADSARCACTENGTTMTTRHRSKGRMASQAEGCDRMGCDHTSPRSAGGRPVRGGDTGPVVRSHRGAARPVVLLDGLCERADALDDLGLGQATEPKETARGDRVCNRHSA